MEEEVVDDDLPELPWKKVTSAPAPIAPVAAFAVIVALAPRSLPCVLPVMRSPTCRQDPKLVRGAKIPDCLQYIMDSWSDQAATKPATKTNANGYEKRSDRELMSVEQVRWGVPEPSTIHACDLLLFYTATDLVRCATPPPLQPPHLHILRTLFEPSSPRTPHAARHASPSVHWLPGEPL